MDKYYYISFSADKPMGVFSFDNMISGVQTITTFLTVKVSQGNQLDLIYVFSQIVDKGYKNPTILGCLDISEKEYEYFTELLRQRGKHSNNKDT